MERRDEASDADYERLRRHLAGPVREHPAGRQQPRAPIAREPQLRTTTRVSVMTWLTVVGNTVVRRLRGAARSPMRRLHPRR